MKINKKKVNDWCKEGEEITPQIRADLVVLDGLINWRAQMSGAVMYLFESCLEMWKRHSIKFLWPVEVWDMSINDKQVDDSKNKSLVHVNILINFSKLLFFNISPSRVSFCWSLVRLMIEWRHLKHFKNFSFTSSLLCLFLNKTLLFSLINL